MGTYEGIPVKDPMELRDPVPFLFLLRPLTPLPSSSTCLLQPFMYSSCGKLESLVSDPNYKGIRKTRKLLTSRTNGKVDSIYLWTDFATSNPQGRCAGEEPHECCGRLGCLVLYLLQAHHQRTTTMECSPTRARSPTKSLPTVWEGVIADARTSSS